MYRPQTYHHIQEIQKYNIQDYRPRCVPAHSFCYHNADTNILRQNGTIPKGHPQGPASAAYAQAARLRILPGRRVADARVTSIRHDARAWAVRRDGQLAAGTLEELVLTCIFSPCNFARGEIARWVRSSGGWDS